MLDLIYLNPGSDEIDFIEELRLQNFGQINRAVLCEFVERFQSPKLNRALDNIGKILDQGEGVEL